jgi:hypothetical protein
MLLGLCYALYDSSPATAATNDPGILKKASQPGAVTNPLGKNRLQIVGDELKTASGSTRVLVQLSGDPLALIPNAGAGNLAQINAAQTALMTTLAAKYGAKEEARLSRAINALIIKVDASNLSAMAGEAGILRIDAVPNYKIADSETVPYIGASTTSNPPLPAGLTGAGLRVAVVDSGVDYTHLDMGNTTTTTYADCAAPGVADQTSYAALPAKCKALFGPGAPKVIGGKDFIGENFTGVAPNNVEEPDANPIDFEGHGSHVSDIIAGVNPSVPGVAPGAKIYALKVCSNSPSGFCSGLGIMEAIDFFLDPDGNGNLSDHVDVANFSLGSDFGQTVDYEDYVLNNAVTAGVIVAAAAGNGGDKPYIVGSPSIAPKVISVAETTVPISHLNILHVNAPPPAVDYGALYQDWSGPFTTDITGPVVFIGEACSPLDAATAAAVRGKIALAQRTPGACYVSTRAKVAKDAGAIALVFGSLVPGDAISYGNGDGLPPSAFVPTFNISYAAFLKLQAALSGGLNITLRTALGNFNIAGKMVSTSSRGPRADNRLKPEIGAPGGSVSMLAGTGTGVGPFGGTSGATPMISGSALLVKQKHPDWDPVRIKSLLMNTAFTDVVTDGADGGTYASPISRIGAGEVRVNRAARSNVLVTVPGEDSAALSFGFQTIDNNVRIFTKKVRIKSLETQGNGRLYNISYKFRNNPNGAISLSGPGSVWLSPGQEQEITVQLMLTGQKVPVWPFTSIPGGTAGFDGAGTAVLDNLELDGYMVVDGGTDNKVSVPFYILPHKSTNVSVKGVFDTWNNGPVKALQLGNDLGVVKARVDAFNLLGTSPQKTVNSTTFNSWDVDLKEFGVREVPCEFGTCLQFAVTTFDRRATPNLPNLFDIYFYIPGSGGGLFEVYNMDYFQATGAGGLSGENVVVFGNALTNQYYILYDTQGDFDSGNVILTIPAVFAPIGLNSAGKTFYTSVAAYDFYYGGPVKDTIGSGAISTWPTYQVGSPKFTLSKLPWTNPGTLDSAGLTLTFDQNGTQVQFNKNASTSNSKGLLLLYRDAISKESDVVLYP